MGLIVTFDVFSALTDSRTGGSSFLQSVASTNGWSVSGVEIYDRWDSLNKESHRVSDPWVPFVDLSALALRGALSELALPDDQASEVSEGLLESMADWPLWPDVSSTVLTKIGAAELGLLSNIDDTLLADTAVMRLGVFDPAFVVTSQRAQAYKPAPALYHFATKLFGRFVHVASSARDVSGALGAGIPCVRLARPGHSTDPNGPSPEWIADSVSLLRESVAAAFESRNE